MERQHINPEYVSGALFTEVQRRLYNGERARGQADSIPGLIDIDVAGEVLPFIMPSTVDILNRHSGGKEHKTLSRKEALRWFYSIRNDFSPDTPEGRYMTANAKSLITYVEAYHETGRMPETENENRDYLYQTLGVKMGTLGQPTPIEDGLINSHLVQAAEIFGSMGYPHTRDGVAQYIQETRVKPQDVEGIFRQTEEKLGPIIRRMYALPSDPSYQMEIANADANWAYYTDYSYERGAFRIRANTHPAVISRLRQGEIERVFTHEYGAHVVQAAGWQRQIADGELNPGTGITRTPDVQAHFEGLGNTLVFFDPNLYNALSVDGRFNAHTRLAETMVMGNAYLMATGLSPAKGSIEEYVLDQLPTYTSERVQRALKSIRQTPYGRAYLFAYGQPSADYYKIAKVLGQQERLDFVRATLTMPMTPEQVFELAEDLAEKSSPSYPESEMVPTV